ncbi:3-hydroxyacyl-CoA dehydrogenase NAD-binding domain-containing protein [Corynebacterium variabile]|uniref:3-hydroxyacyl-CoA dehydrogenase NAD-binding domain-containing protein n=1 Tax=Corynebacterium variabile TaxID=1727 RepID=UPI003F937E3A
MIGAGTIGQSRTRLFASHGMTVTVFDPRPDLADVVDQIRTESGVGDPRLVRMADSLADAVADADLIQENGPERPEVKQELFADIAASAPDHAVFATSSSAITASVIAEAMPADQAARVIVGHPFNPPHLMPLVEVVPGAHTTEDTVERSLAFYASVGRRPVRLHKESTGFVGNRLQNAVLREAVYLVEEGIVDAADLDDAVKNSLGLRWSAVGPLEGMHLGGGEGGLRGFMKHIGPSFASIPPATPDMGTEGMEPVFTQVEAAYGQPPRAELVEKRDWVQEAVLGVTGQVHKQ